MRDHVWPHILLVSLLLVLSGCQALTGLFSDLEDTPDDDSYTGFTVDGRHLYDPCSERVVLRGVNVMVVWLDEDRDGLPAFREIAKTGANTVRIVWTTEVPPNQFDQALSNAVDRGLLPIIELHDATGEWEKLGTLVDYWTDPATVEVIRRHEDRLLVNVANEAGDNDVTDEQFKQGYAEAVARMREAGIRTPILIDAAGWGRDAEQLLRTAPWLRKQDPRDNLMFSVHWWHADNDRDRITKTLSRAVELDVPLIVGEFAHKKVGCEGQIAYPHLLEETARLDVGWLAWSWGPGNSDCSGMDMTEDGTVETLHGWGREVALTDSFSIKHTSKRPPSMVDGGCPAK